MPVWKEKYKEISVSEKFTGVRNYAFVILWV